MARVFIDAHMFGSDWLPLEDLIKSKKVRFLFSNCRKGIKEINATRLALEFQKRVLALRKADFADEVVVEALVEKLTENAAYCGCRECDDPHIMAAIYIHPAKYVFTRDARLAQCRDKMTGVINKRFLSFIVVSTAQVFAIHRAAIL